MVQKWNFKQTKIKDGNRDSYKVRERERDKVKR